VGILVFAWPSITHWLDAPVDSKPAASAPSDADVVRQMEEMARQPDEAASAPDQP